MKKLLIIFIFSLFLSFANINVSNAEEEILIIFDASISMADQVGNEQKYIIASEAVRNYLSNLNPNTKVGLRIIGLQFNQNLLEYISNIDLLCKGTKLINPVSYNNTDNINKTLDKIFPLGVSPLTYSIKSAIDNDFSQYANPKHIILITDGAESCNENPCLFSRQVLSQRHDLIIDIIAIDVKSGDLVQLKCITEATNGNLYNIKTSSELNSAFKSVQNHEPVNDDTIQYKNYLIETID